MARQRRIGLEPHARRAARDLIRGGLSAPAAARTLATQFPGITQTRLGEIARQEAGRQQAVDNLMGANRGQFRVTSSLAGCTDPAAPVYARITVQYTDPVSGERRRFGHTVVLMERGRLGAILDEAVAQVVSEARRKGYNSPDIQGRGGSGDATFTVEYIECRQ